MSPMSALFATDPEVSAILGAELDRQQHTLVMIASENYASEAILAPKAASFCNKYAKAIRQTLLPGL